MLAEGMNRYPSFAPGGEQIAFFRADHRRGCTLLVATLTAQTPIQRYVCQGIPASPAAWLDSDTLVLAVNDQISGHSTLEKLELSSSNRTVIYQSESRHVLQFPRLTNEGQLIALLTSQENDTLLELDILSGNTEVIYETRRGAIRWLDVDSQQGRILMVKVDPTNRFVLFEANLEQRTVRLIGNHELVQSASYHPDGDGVVFSAIRYERSHSLHRRDSDGYFSTDRIKLDDASVPFTLIDPAGERLLYVTTAAPGMSLYSMQVNSGRRLKLMTSQKNEQLGYPAWSKDGARAIVAATSASGNAVYLVDVEQQRILSRISVQAAVGPVQLSRDGRHAVLTEQRWSTIVVHRLNLNTGLISTLFEVPGAWGQMADDGESYYVVGKDLNLRQVRYAVDGIKLRDVVRVGSVNAWTAQGDRLYFACFNDASDYASLCEVEMPGGEIRLHTEVRFTPVRVSVSADGNTLATARFENVKVVLVHAQWSTADPLHSTRAPGHMTKRPSSEAASASPVVMGPD